MRQFVSLSLTVAAVVPMFWATVAPRGREICDSNIVFNYYPDSVFGQKAGKAAKSAFCRTVTGK